MMGWKIKNQDLKMNGIYANSHRSHPYLWAPSMHYAFLKKRAKNVQLWAIVSSGFSSKNRNILRKVVLTPQEYQNYFFIKKIYFWWTKMGLGNGGLRYPHKLIRCCPPIYVLYCVCLFHHIFDHLKNQFCFDQFYKKKLELGQPP